MTGGRRIEPLDRPPDAVVRVPGSKSITNRALVCAALADGTSTLSGALLADDTDAMIGCLGALGIDAAVDAPAATITVTGAGGPPTGDARLDARLSGTTARFILPVTALGAGTFEVDGLPPLRARPMTASIESLRHIGAEIEELAEPGHLPVIVHAHGVDGGAVEVAGDGSSQYLSGLLLSGPYMREGLRAATARSVSTPFIEITRSVMASFGIRVDADGTGSYAVAPGRYRATDLDVEPDATAASYLLAAAAITGGRVRVEGLGRHSVQGDLAFLDVLEQMGMVVERSDAWVEVRGGGDLHGVDVDLRALPDMAQTVAAVAVFAGSKTTVRGVEVIRHHETDRIAAVVTELQRVGISAEAHDDGFTVHPGAPRPAQIQTYDDHRMAMSFALLGLRATGIEIMDPACVAKTFPRYFDALDGLR